MKISKELAKELENISEAILTQDGKELLNPIPVATTFDLERPLTLQEQVRRLMHVELSAAASEQGAETLEESMDMGEDEPRYSDEVDSMYQAAAAMAEKDFPVMKDELLAEKQNLEAEARELASKPNPETPPDQGSEDE